MVVLTRFQYLIVQSVIIWHCDYIVNMSRRTRTGTEPVRCCGHRPGSGPVKTWYGMCLQGTFSLRSDLGSLQPRDVKCFNRTELYEIHNEHKSTLARVMA